MPNNHWLTLTPRQFIDTLIPEKASSSNKNSLRIRIFIIAASNKILSTSESEIPMYPHPVSSSSSILSFVMQECISAPLRKNTFRNSYQVLDFAFDRPIFDAQTLDVAVNISIAEVPDLMPVLTLKDLEHQTLGESSQEFFYGVLDLIEDFPPTLDAAQRRALMLRQLSAVVSAKEMAGELRYGHEILVLLFKPEGDDDARLILMQADAEKTKQWELDEVARFLHQGNDGWADWVGTFRREANREGMRSMSLAENWSVEESLFGSDGRLEVSWTKFSNQQRWLQPGQRPSMEEFALVDWLSG